MALLRILGYSSLFLMILALRAGAETVTLFDNGSFSGSQVQLRNNMCAEFDEEGICTSRFTIYDQFVLVSDSVITSIEWHQTEHNPQNYAGTLLTIGVGTPSPGSILHAIDVLANRVLTPIPDGDPRFESIPSGSFEAAASVPGLAIDLAPGTYWLGIHNKFPQFGGGSQWTQTIGTNQTVSGRWQGEGNPCGAFPPSPDGGCLKYFPQEDSAFRVIGRLGILIEIDIKPGSDPNCFNSNSHGVIPVAILGSAEFDTSLVDQGSLSFGGLQVRVRGNKGPFCGSEDTNSDGFADLVCHFEDDTSAWVAGNSGATVTGSLLDGTAIEGSDSICIVP
ncbi:MAG: hypothetical protein OEM85_01760 [Gammaproteobacteria bacterium]|nr:hypothetical protein [Gammaproteobacteria bacterium]MDH3408427.1 hypothetical protein [Gammaproteobacteria bacterium]